MTKLNPVSQSDCQDGRLFLLSLQGSEEAASWLSKLCRGLFRVNLHQPTLSKSSTYNNWQNLYLNRIENELIGSGAFQCCTYNVSISVFNFFDWTLFKCITRRAAAVWFNVLWYGMSASQILTWKVTSLNEEIQDWFLNSVFLWETGLSSHKVMATSCRYGH